MGILVRQQVRSPEHVGHAQPSAVSSGCGEPGWPVSNNHRKLVLFLVDESILFQAVETALLLQARCLYLMLRWRQVWSLAAGGSVYLPTSPFWFCRAPMRQGPWSAAAGEAGGAASSLLVGSSDAPMKPPLWLPPPPLPGGHRGHCWPVPGAIRGGAIPAGATMTQHPKTR